MSYTHLSPKLQMARRLFFDAMKGGWAAGAKGTPVLGKPGWEEIIYHDDVLGASRVVDRYFVGEGGRSHGWIEIYVYDILVWRMSYCGVYQKSEIPFLKTALMNAYANEEFRGGRGCNCRGEILIYKNDFALTSDFTQFQGHEGIFTFAESSINAPRIVGYHTYIGGALID